MEKSILSTGWVDFKGIVKLVLILLKFDCLYGIIIEIVEVMLNLFQHRTYNAANMTNDVALQQLSFLCDPQINLGKRCNRLF